MPASDAGVQETSYLNVLALVTTLLLSFNSDVWSTGDSTDPNAWACILNFLHSIAFWSLFTTMWTTLFTVYTCVHYSVAVPNIHIPSLFFASGIFSYVVQVCVNSIPFFYGRILAGKIVDETASFLSYAIIQYLHLLTSPFLIIRIRNFALRQRALADTNPNQLTRRSVRQTTATSTSTVHSLVNIPTERRGRSHK